MLQVWQAPAHAPDAAAADAGAMVTATVSFILCKSVVVVVVVLLLLLLLLLLCLCTLCKLLHDTHSSLFAEQFLGPVHPG
jgi:hypothetical protein